MYSIYIQDVLGIGTYVNRGIPMIQLTLVSVLMVGRLNTQSGSTKCPVLK